MQNFQSKLVKLFLVSSVSFLFLGSLTIRPNAEVEPIKPCVYEEDGTLSKDSPIPCAPAIVPFNHTGGPL